MRIHFMTALRPTFQGARRNTKTQSTSFMNRYMPRASPRVGGGFPTESAAMTRPTSKRRLQCFWSKRHGTGAILILNQSERARHSMLHLDRAEVPLNAFSAGHVLSTCANVA
eukprot:4425053-Amphidinium_carterae.1